MNVKILVVFVLMALMIVGSVSAAGLSIQLKRTNVGIVGQKPAELIFDVVNTDFGSSIEGFLWCRSPDDATVSSTLGAAAGSGAQYISEKFYMDTGPSQKSISLVIEADFPGDKRTGCTIKYAPYQESAGEGKTTTTEINYEGTIGLTDTDVSGYKVKLLAFTPAVSALFNNETNESVPAAPAKTKISVNGIEKEIEVGSSATISSVAIRLISASENGADVKITGKVTSTSGGTVTRQYKKMNGELVSSLTDEQYRELRLDKTIPFVKASKNAEVNCPKGKETCTASEVDIKEPGFAGVPVWVYILGVVLIVLVIAYLVGKTSRRNY